MGEHAAIPDLGLRPAHGRDHARCAEIFLRARLAAFPGRRSGSFDLEDYYHAIADDEVRVAETGGTVVGFVSLYRPESQIRNLFVDPAWQHRGIGSRLLAEARSRVRTPARLSCLANNGAARAFYEHNGWTAEGLTGRWADEGVVYRK